MKLTDQVVDQQAREQALNISRSIIVQAPAGSGKTEILCQRFLAALATVKQPEQVLAITFTRKAANEMRERILRYLQDPQQPLAQQALAQDQKYQWQLLAHPERLSVMTIDGLCARIVEQAPITSAIFGYQTTELANELYRSAVIALLEDADQAHPWQQALHALLLQCGNNWQKLHDLLITMLAKREQWLMLLPEINDPNQWRYKLEKNLTDCLQAAMDGLNQALTQDLKIKLFSLLKFAAQQLPLFSPWLELERWPEANVSQEIYWRLLAQFLLTKENQLRKMVDKRAGFPVDEGEDKAYFKSQKQSMMELLTEASVTEGLLEALQEMQIAPPAKYSEAEWQRVMIILSVLRALLAYWQLTIDQKKQVDFTEIALRALTALGNDEEPTELALTLDYRLQHILVDEFQDTSLLQYRLLERLTQSWQDDDGHSLFLVGDPLQSIYRFRQAEVGLFLRTWQQGFANLTLQNIQLQQNFRAQKNLVEFYNQQLAQVLPHVSVISQSAVAYVPVVAAKPAYQSTVIFNHSEQSCVSQIIADLQQLQADNPQVKVAILVRSRSHLEEILPALQQVGIDYQARDLTSLGEQPVIIDLLTWLKALLNLEDRLSWLAMLHSPSLGLSLTSLQQLFEKNTSLVWSRLLDWRSNPLESINMPMEENTRLNHIIDLWQQALAQLQRKPLDQILQQLWRQLAAVNYWSDALSIQASKQFWLMLQQAQSAGDLVDLVQFERTLLQTAFVAKEQNQALEIMTIHKAKGLEFDVVLLPGLERPGQYDDPPLLLFDEIILPAGPRFILAPLRDKSNESDAIFDFIWQVQKNKAYQERLRVLYVACTRAKQTLYFYAQIPRQEDEIKKPKQGSFLADLWPLFENSFS